MSFILQTNKPGLSEEDKNKSNKDTLKAIPIPVLFPKRRKTKLEIANGKKQTENSNKIYKIETTDFLYFARSIAG